MRLLGVSLGHADLLRDELRKVSAVARVDLRVAQIGGEAARDRLGQIGAGRLRLARGTGGRGKPAIHGMVRGYGHPRHRLPRRRVGRAPAATSPSSSCTTTR